ncbi:MAG TPA: Holliday junction resolvase RuvX [Candidatus Limnocylindrales bacterium]|nr:Holliday junction resolvase RuvX [Candidatus Limnocylindrales bacterium]
MRVLGVDFGLRRIGLALSDEEARLASPLRSLAISGVGQAPGAVASAALEADAGAIVVGAPLGLEGEEGRIEMRRVRRFAQALRRATGLPVHLVDESLSSREAEAAAGGGKGGGGARGRARDEKREALHAAAAAVILQRWLDEER